MVRVSLDRTLGLVLVGVGTDDYPSSVKLYEEFFDTTNE